MRCLVIGASSYIAKTFIQKYQEQFTITALSRNKDLKSYFDLTNQDFKEYDVLINFTAIVHQKNPDKTLARLINTQLPIFLAKKAKEAGITQFIQMSTIAVYATGLTKIDQNSETLPSTLYGQTKLEADQELSTMQSSNFNIVIMRPPIVYGKSAPGNMASLILLLQKGVPLPFLYTKNQRAILYVENLTTALSLAIEKHVNGLFLLSDTYAPSLARLCTEINHHQKKSTKLFSLPILFISILIYFKQLPFYKIYDNLILDDSYTQQQLGQYNTVPFNIAISRTMKRGLC